MPHKNMLEKDKFERFFELYPKGFCLFLLVGEDKCYLFGPKIHYVIMTNSLQEASKRIADDIRDYLNVQIGTNIQSLHPSLPKPFCLFFCERQNLPFEKAKPITDCFYNFLNEKVFGNNMKNRCATPIYLKQVSYLGYGGGMGLDKKKDFSAFIQGAQGNLDASSREKITLEVVYVNKNEEVPICEPKTITIYPKLNPGFVWGMFSTAAFSFVALVIWGFKKG